MSRKCQVTDKKTNNAYAVSHSHVRTKKLQHVNLQSKKMWSNTQKRWIKVKISTKAIKSIHKFKL